MFTNRYRQIKLLSVLCLLLLAATGKSSGPYQPQVVNPLSESWRWKPFPELEGKGVRYIMEGRDQKVWMSFNNGIFEYNGYSWKVHNAENGLTSYPAEQVFAARNGYIYATTPKGIFRYDGALWEAIFSAEGGITFDFLQIKELSDGSLMACSDQGVLHFSKKGRPDFYTSSAKVSRLRNEVEGVACPGSSGGIFFNVGKAQARAQVEGVASSLCEREERQQYCQSGNNQQAPRSVSERLHMMQK